MADLAPWPHAKFSLAAYGYKSGKTQSQKLISFSDCVQMASGACKFSILVSNELEDAFTSLNSKSSR